jgi:hypothetical protein
MLKSSMHASDAPVAVTYGVLGNAASRLGAGIVTGPAGDITSSSSGWRQGPM